MPEFSVELLPAFTDGLANITNALGIDAAQATQDQYTQPYLSNGVIHRSVCQRKSDALFGFAPCDGARGHGGWVNVWPDFVHATLAFVNPPQSIDVDAATSFLKVHMSGELRLLAQTVMPVLTFSSKLENGSASGGRTVCRIESDIAVVISTLRQQLRQLFERYGWFIRFPQCEPQNRVHITVRDERYGLTSTSQSWLRPGGTISVMFEKLAVTPAAENDPRHDARRQYCGATSWFPFTTHVSNSSVSTGSPLLQVSLEDRESFPALSLRVPQRKTGKRLPRASAAPDPTPFETVFHPDPAARAEPQGDRDIAAALRSTVEESVSHPLAGDGRAASLAHSVSGQSSEAIPTEISDEKVHVLRYNSCDPQFFFEKVLQSERLKPYTFELPSKARMLVKPVQRQAVEQAILEQDLELHQFHVVVAESLEAILEQVLATIPYKRRPRAKKGREQLIMKASKGSAGSADMQGDGDRKYDVVVERTFLCVVPVLRDSKTVAQSTTEAVTEVSEAHYSSFRGVNPRRHLV